MRGPPVRNAVASRAKLHVGMVIAAARPENHVVMTATCETERLLSCKNSQGENIQATPLRLTRHLVVFEIDSSHAVLRMSEVLSEFRILDGDRPVYAGRAVVASLINTGTTVVCEATLEDCWVDAELFSLLEEEDGLADGFNEFFQRWERRTGWYPSIRWW